MWAIFVSFLYTGLLVRAFSHLHSVNLTYHSKSLAVTCICFPFVCTTGLTEICLSLISLLELFQGITCNIETLKGDLGALHCWVQRHKLKTGPYLKGEPQNTLHTMTPLNTWLSLGTQPCYKVPCNLWVKHW